jgi:hypothetical protein
MFAVIPCQRFQHLCIYLSNLIEGGLEASKRPEFVLEWHWAQQSYPEQAAQAQSGLK